MPVVRNWQTAGGSCTGSLAVGAQIDEAATQFKCTAAPDETLIVLLETTRGSCWKTVEAEFSRVVLKGTVLLSEPTTYVADVIEIEPGTRIVTNGNDLLLSARKRLSLSGTSRIESFQAREGRASKEHGRHAAPIVIRAKQLVGTRLFVDNSGEDGAPGATGERGKQGAKGAPGRGGTRDVPMKGCTGRRDADAGGRGQQGGTGEPGGDAGDGGPVTVSIENGRFDGDVDRVVIVRSRKHPATGKAYQCAGTCHGVAGAGGPGGEGGPGGPGGDGQEGKHGCGGGKGGAPGPKGESGARGNAGLPGREGPVQSL